MFREELHHLITKEQRNKNINEEILNYVCQVKIANWIFQMPDQSSDTIKHGAYMIELSVDYCYLQAIRTLLLLLSQNDVLTRVISFVYLFQISGRAFEYSQICFHNS
jgi:hypothetical protein